MQSPTYGTVTMEQMIAIIKSFIGINGPDREYKLVVGTDSQNFDYTKVVLVVALLNVGHGGIFFYDVTRHKRISDVRQKLFMETQLSLDYANTLLQALEQESLDDPEFDYTKINYSIHVDAGYNGPTKAVIPEIVAWVKSCGFDCQVKPESYVASSIADKYSK